MALIATDYQRQRAQLVRDSLGTARALASTVDSDLASVKISATLKNMRRDRNQGVAAQRTFEWRYSPRNLAYERNQ